MLWYEGGYGHSVFAAAGEDVTLTAGVYALYTDKQVTNLGYTYVWYRVKDDEREKVHEGDSYTFTVSEEDLYHGMAVEGNVHYEYEAWDGERQVCRGLNPHYYIYERDAYFSTEYTQYVPADEGTYVDLTPEIRDWQDEPADPSAFTYVW